MLNIRRLLWSSISSTLFRSLVAYMLAATVQQYSDKHSSKSILLWASLLHTLGINPYTLKSRPWQDTIGKRVGKFTTKPSWMWNSRCQLPKCIITTTQQKCWLVWYSFCGLDNDFPNRSTPNIIICDFCFTNQWENEIATILVFVRNATELWTLN